MLTGERLSLARARLGRSPTLLILAGFVAGLLIGTILPKAAAAIAPIGTIWVKAMTALVVPLVVSLLITSIASLSDARAVGRIGGRAIAVFIALLVSGAIVMALVTPFLITLLGAGLDNAPFVASISGSAPVAAPVPGFWQWVASLIPANPVAAASEGALLPLVIFTVAFAAATTKLPGESRAHVVGFFRGVAAAMLELVRWVLWLAPLGVFGLAYSLGARTGLGGAHALLVLFLIVGAACIVYIAALYAIAVIVGRVPLAVFARAVLPAQIVGFSSRSSLASLPAMIEAADLRLRLPPAVTGFLLPLAVSTFKLGATIAFMTSSLFLARLYGVPITVAQVISVAVSSVVLSFSTPGIPGGVLLIMIPVLTSIGIPAEAVAILLAADVIPDMFRTVTNVTADMTAAVVMTRWTNGQPSVPA